MPKYIQRVPQQATHIRHMTNQNTYDPYLNGILKRAGMNPDEDRFRQLRNDLTYDERSYCELVAKHLTEHYMTGQIDAGWSNLPSMRAADFKALESGYKTAVKYAVDLFESALWLEVKQYFGIIKMSKGARKPSWDRVSEILKYKTVGKTKRAVRRYLYS